MKRSAAIFLILTLFLTLLTTACAVQSIGVSIDGQAVSFTQTTGAPFIDENNRTLVPLRAVMEQYGCTVTWDGSTKTACVTLHDTAVQITVGEKQILTNGQASPIDAPAQIKDGRTYLPIRAVLEAFGAQVSWNKAARTVAVSRPAAVQVHFIDVGQADSILITSMGEAMLIDAGNNDDGSIILPYLQSCGIAKLKYAVGTHPHEDHIGALDDVLYALEVEHLLMPQIQANTNVFEDVLDAALAANLRITAPKAGDTFSLGEAVLTCVSDYHGDDLNNASIMLHMVCGKTAFLFTGDAEQDAEEAALATGLRLRCDVLKVGHHGSSTSSSPAFLAAAAPNHAVISCGKDNDYGHPHKQTMAALGGCTIYRTDEMGTVVATSDGTAVTFNTVGIQTDAPAETVETGYVLNTNSKKFHLPTCGGVTTMSEANKMFSSQTRQQLIAAGYAPCGTCNP